MNHSWKRVLAVAVGAICLIVASLPGSVEAHGKHPGRARRVKSCTTKGDVRMTRSVAGHTVNYALGRHQLQDRVTPADIDRAVSEMYNFLKRKLGNPTAVCAQYISTGYGHFERAYSDEARTMLLGVSGRLRPWNPKVFKGKTKLPGAGSGNTPCSDQNPENCTCEDDPQYCVDDTEYCQVWAQEDDQVKEYCQSLTAFGSGQSPDYGSYEQSEEREAPTPPTLEEREVPGFSSGEPPVQGGSPWPWKEELEIPEGARSKE